MCTNPKPAESANSVSSIVTNQSAAAVLLANAVDRHNALTEWGAQLYFWGRVSYLPLYAAGIPLVRSLVWNVAAVGILLCLVALFWN